MFVDWIAKKIGKNKQMGWRNFMKLVYEKKKNSILDQKDRMMAKSFPWYLFFSQ